MLSLKSNILNLLSGSQFLVIYSQASHYWRNSFLPVSTSHFYAKASFIRDRRKTIVSFCADRKYQPYSLHRNHISHNKLLLFFSY